MNRIQTVRRVAGRIRRALDVRRQRAVSVRGVKVRMQTASRRERDRVRSYTTKEPGTLDWIDRVLKPGDVFFDVGANIGQYGIYAALRELSANVYCFEPESANYEALNRNIALNRLSGRVIGLLVAISDGLAASELLIAGEGGAGEALHQLASGSGPEVGRRQGVIAISLDALVFDLGVPFPSHIKIDVDGHEEAIVRGARRVLADHRLRSVLIEVNARDEVIRGAFAQGGLAPVHARPAGAETESVNVVFERR